MARLWLLPCILLGACSSQPAMNPRDAADANDTGGRLVPNGQGERAVLGRLSTLPSGKPERIGDETVLVGAPYLAASGQTCRPLDLTGGPASSKRHRLACTDGRAWFFVPDVFGRSTLE